jgi:hypothetical protein
MNRGALRTVIKMRISADNREMSTRVSLTVGLTIAALLFGGWRTLMPQADKASEAAGQSADAMIGAVVQAYFTGAEVSLDVQRSATGSYAGASVQAPITLVRADATSYCIQLDRPPLQQHVIGPGGVAVAGPCT